MLRRLWQRIRPPKLVVWITPELAVGPSFYEWQLHLLAKAGIGSVIDVRSEASDDEGELARRDIHFYHVAVDDFKAPTQEQFRAATKWALDEIAAGRKIYVHCRSGVGRSPCLTCAILMAVGYPLGDAYSAVRRQRPWATLTNGQWEALRQFEGELRSEHAAGRHSPQA
jgi:protein-tyrosine phosphatase